MTSQNCFHCGLAVPTGVTIHVHIQNQDQSMCCNGCAAVADAILSAGLSRYYQHRTADAMQGKALVPDELHDLTIYNHPKIQHSFVHSPCEADNKHIKQAALILEGITCAACVWLNEQHLHKLDGVLSVDVNYTSHRATVQWDERLIKLADILEAIHLIGYKAHPYDPSLRQQLVESERKDTLKRLGIAGTFGMQVMALAISLYLDDGTMDAGIRSLLYKISLLLTLPVLLYAAKPFFTSALVDYRNHRFGMDTPVAIGISLAFAASTYAVVTQSGEIYFDSVCMFTFFLTGARYLELAARRRAADAADLVGHAKPTLAHRQEADGSLSPIAAVELNPGDIVVVQAGQNIPADGVIIDGVSSVDEAILTGESLALTRTIGARVIGGSVNVESPLTINVSKVGADSVLSGIQRLLDKAQTAKPRIAQLADRVAGYFVLFILSLASFTAAYWLWAAPEQWLATTVAVLIVSCPCALSLATPAAITTAISQLMKNGVVISNKVALENLPKTDHIFFDKTGTLTHGTLQIDQQLCFNPAYKNQHLSIAAAIEQHSEHAIAQAFSTSSQKLSAKAVINVPGSGLQGEINQETWFIGTPQFIRQHTGHTLSTESHLQLSGYTCVVLANKLGIIAAYGLSDRLREEAKPLINWLKKQHISVTMLTGDNAAAARKVADELGIEYILADQSPEQKMAAIQMAQKQCSHVTMVGDGVNDAGVLATANSSIAVFGAAPLAIAGSDVLLLSPQLSVIQLAIITAQKTHRIIKQNLVWALAYNTLAIPAAALGFVPPWLAAIGMSLSSLIVVLNALRLKSAVAH